jgi:hypothetical protein
MDSIPLKKIKKLIKEASKLQNETNEKGNPSIGIHEETGKLVLWLIYADQFWAIDLENFDFDNIEEELEKNKKEILDYIANKINEEL